MIVIYVCASFDFVRLEPVSSPGSLVFIVGLMTFIIVFNLISTFGWSSTTMVVQWISPSGMENPRMRIVFLA